MNEIQSSKTSPTRHFYRLYTTKVVLERDIQKGALTAETNV